jgi:hypothetical protein
MPSLACYHLLSLNQDIIEHMKCEQLINKPQDPMIKKKTLKMLLYIYIYIYKPQDA